MLALPYRNIVLLDRMQRLGQLWSCMMAALRHSSPTAYFPPHLEAGLCYDGGQAKYKGGESLLCPLFLLLASFRSAGLV